jgi:hypothetical protein
VLQPITHRRAGKHVFKIEDEYDVQDVLHSMLLVAYDDIRREEWTPSYAGGSSRMDLLVREEQAVVEVKLAREGHSDREIGGELLVDVERYRRHADCGTLVCLIYDPGDHISNPNGLSADLENASSDEFSVKVLVVPARS